MFSVAIAIPSGCFDRFERFAGEVVFGPFPPDVGHVPDIEGDPVVVRVR